jgi:hypothetical protein
MTTEMDMHTAHAHPMHHDVATSLDDLADELDRTDRSIRTLILLALGAALAMALLGLASQVLG